MRRIKGYALLLIAFFYCYPSEVVAKYHASSDTGTEIFDFLEQEHRIKRKKVFDKEQEELKRDLKIQENEDLATEKPLAFDFWAKNITYDFKTGDFIAQGNVKITENMGRRILGDKVLASSREKSFIVPDTGNFLSIARDFPSVHVTGKNLHYFSLSKRGSLDDFSGKVGSEFVRGKKLEFFPDRLVIYDGKATKSSAKKPEYLWQAKRIEIFTDKKMLLQDTSLVVFGKTIYRKKRHETSVDGTENTMILPRAGFNTADGCWLSYDDSVPIFKNISLGADLFYSVRHGFRNIGEVNWQNGSNFLALQYGFLEDRDQKWIKKSPSLVYTYARQIPKTLWQANFYAEYGSWQDKKISSRHRYMGISFRRKPITFSKYRLFLSGLYGMTLESYDNSRTDGFSYDAILLREFTPKLWAFAGYHYAAINAQTTLFSYGIKDCSRSIDTGVSLRLTDNDRVVVGSKYDLDVRDFTDIDYYWYHDMHSVESIIRYREKRNRWQFLLQFTPW